MRSCFRQGGVDRQDIISEKVLQNIDWNRLEHLAMAEDELKASVLNDKNYAEFLVNYEEYVRRYRP